MPKPKPPRIPAGAHCQACGATLTRPTCPKCGAVLVITDGPRADALTITPDPAGAPNSRTPGSRTRR